MAVQSRVTITTPAGVALPGILSRPAGAGRHPAVLLLHGCTGMWSVPNRTAQPHLRHWLASLARHGVLALSIDSFTPRGVQTVCGRSPEKTGISEVVERKADALAALAWLRKRSDVRSNRLGVFGWSNGGSTALGVLANRRAGVRFGVAWYPGCGLRGMKRLRPPVTTLVLGAGQDPLLADCLLRRRAAGRHFQLVVGRGANHGFDRATSRSAAADRRAQAAGRRRVLALVRRYLTR